MTLAGALSVAELATRWRVLSPWAVGALLGAWAASADWPVIGQVAVFLMGAMLVLVFVLFIIEEPVGSEHRIKPQYIVGTLARAIDPVDQRSGVIQVLGETWPARSLEPISPDSRVRIIQVANTETTSYLIVEPLVVPASSKLRNRRSTPRASERQMA